MGDAPQTMTPGGPRFVWVLVLGTLLIGLAAYLGWRVGGAESTPAAVRGDAPDFQLATLDGSRLGPADFRGKVLLVDFWATWCGPCRLQAEILEPLSRELSDQGVQFLAVDVGEAESTVRQFAAEHPFAYPVLIDPADQLSERLGIEALPTLMVIDRGGRVVYFQPGVTDAPTLRSVLRHASEAARS